MFLSTFFQVLERRAHDVFQHLQANMEVLTLSLLKISLPIFGVKTLTCLQMQQRQYIPKITDMLGSDQTQPTTPILFTLIFISLLF